MKSRALLFLVACAPLALACQQMDNTAGSQDPPLDPGSVPDPGDGTIPTETTTPQILRPDGTMTSNPCDKVRDDAKKIRETHCAFCHQAATPGANVPAGVFPFIMEDDMLISVATTNTQFIGLGLDHYVKPGDPDHSLIYYRAAIVGDMPKPAPDPRVMSLPATTLSDDSILREWILHCMGSAPAN